MVASPAPGSALKLSQFFCVVRHIVSMFQLPTGIPMPLFARLRTTCAVANMRRFGRSLDRVLVARTYEKSGRFVGFLRLL